MNKCEIVGRMTRDPETSNTASGNVATRFSIAVNRRFKNANGNYDADFINCIAFGKTAEFISKYFSKGMAIGLVGRIQTGSYTNKDGKKVYTTDVVAEEVEFVDSKSSNSNSDNSESANSSNGLKFDGVPDETDSDFPF